MYGFAKTFCVQKSWAIVANDVGIKTLARVREWMDIHVFINSTIETLLNIVQQLDISSQNGIHMPLNNRTVPIDLLCPHALQQ